MKKVINKKVYDTGKAKKIGRWDNGLYGNDINACAETLYRTKSGAYFLHGSGGSNTKYATVSGSSWGSGEKIVPLDEDAAKEWAKKHLSEEAFGSAFEHIPKSKCVSAILKADQLEKLDRLRRETGKTISAIISDAVDQL
mgnify:FL=1